MRRWLGSPRGREHNTALLLVAVVVAGMALQSARAGDWWWMGVQTLLAVVGLCLYIVGRAEPEPERLPDGALVGAVEGPVYAPPPVDDV